MRNKNRKIYIIGLNSFKIEEISSRTKELLFKVKNIAIPESYFDEIKNLVCTKFNREKNFFSSKSDIALIEWLKVLNNDAILISRGDPLWYGIGRILLKHFSREELLFYPSKTCVQLAFSKLKRPWQDTTTLSIHGRNSDELIKALNQKKTSIAILTDPKNNSLELIRKNLSELNLENYYEFWLIEDIGSDQEKISLISNKENSPAIISNLFMVVLLKKELIYKNLKLPLFGIDDINFQTFADRPNLITKREIRIQLLADLELPELGTLFDIGSGTGTIGLEALRIRAKLDLISIDKRFGSKVLIEENSKRLNVTPLKIIEGDVKKHFNNIFKNYLSDSNRILIGGCDVETKIQIIKSVSKFLKEGDIVVLPIITYEVLQRVSYCLKQLNYETNINLIQTFKGLSISEGTRFEPNNPVFIIKAKKK